MDYRIDLTEHRDFNRPIDRSVHSLTDINLDDELMTNDDYDRIVAWENMFGKRRHDNRKRLVFRASRERAYFESAHLSCLRCGVEFREPWRRRQSGLCADCDDTFNHGLSGIPWRSRTDLASGLADDRGWNLFNLR